jgi:hypothetical protein
MTIELQAGDDAGRVADPGTAIVGPDSRPNVSGDLDDVLAAAPMFRRAVVGYDRFQVDTYVQWAEEELATAERQRAQLLGEHLRARAELERAEELLTHSSAGGEFLRVSERIGTLLAAAADEADALRTDAEAHRRTASTEAERLVARAEQRLARAEADAGRMVTEAVSAAERTTAAANDLADRIVGRAQQLERTTEVAVRSRLDEVRAFEQRAAREAERLRVDAESAASLARLQARDDAVRMLTTAREQRRRADAAAAAARDGLDRDAVERRAWLRAEVELLETRRAQLREELEHAAAPGVRRPGAVGVRVRAHLERIRGHLAAPPVPRRSR